MLVKWISEHHAILQGKSKIIYALSSNFSQVIPMFLQFYRYSLSVTTKPSYTTKKEQIILVTWVSEHHAILQ